MLDNEALKELKPKQVLFLMEYCKLGSVQKTAKVIGMSERTYFSWTQRNTLFRYFTRTENFIECIQTFRSIDNSAPSYGENKYGEYVIRENVRVMAMEGKIEVANMVLDSLSEVFKAGTKRWISITDICDNVNNFITSREATSTLRQLGFYLSRPHNKMHVRILGVEHIEERRRVLNGEDNIQDEGKGRVSSTDWRYPFWRPELGTRTVEGVRELD